jgi:hypothetical protein
MWNGQEHMMKGHKKITIKSRYHRRKVRFTFIYVHKIDVKVIIRCVNPCHISLTSKLQSPHPSQENAVNNKSKKYELANRQKIPLIDGK